ncbi:MAG: helix-turn-helix transcriptional regulator [Gammaproteobacteria bacterium]
MNKLSCREVQIIRYSAVGCSAKEIARLLGLEHRTVEAYVVNIRKKLSAKNIAHAVCIAIQQNIVNIRPE